MTFLKTILGIFCLVLFSPIARCQLVWSTPAIAADSGEVVGLSFDVTGYQNIISSQGTIQFDDAILEFSHLDSFGLASISAASFGETEIDAGLLSFSWFESDLVGKSIQDGEAAFWIFFTVIGNPGSVSPIELIDQPTVAEFIDEAFVSIPFNYVQGSVTVNGGTQPSGLEENQHNSNTVIYPNPFTEWLKVEMDNLGENIDVTWFNLAGEAVRSDQFLINQSTVKMNTSDLNQGIYVIRIGNERIGFENQLIQKL